MKYCSNCGHKNESIGGKLPKFCSNCGEPLSASAKIEVKESKMDVGKEEESLIPEISAEDVFEISESSDFNAFKFGDIAVGATKEYIAPRPHKTLDQIQKRLNQDKFEAE